ncbi:MAG: hypothetical protein OYK82_06110 [Gammaproteobacteria bacterium]|nr:hypothetical protein [Gammaproteobacteria bacterium]
MGVAVPRRLAAVPGGVQLDLSASGRGKRQTLLLSRRTGDLGPVLPQDRTDARLEVLGHRETCIQTG